MDGMITAGRVAGLFGGKGELSLALYDAFPRDPNREEPVFVEIDGHRVPFFFERFARRGVRGATALFADIDTQERASELVGLTFYIRAEGSDGAVSGDEIYFEDLVGWKAVVGQGRTGRITAFFDSELNPLLEITLDGETELIPAVEEFIASIDEDRRRITFDLPDGLLGLNS
jgi:16S rRNA processing protein RimM